MSLSRERLKQLEDIETDVVKVIESASQSLLELSKQQPVEDYVISRTTEFLKGKWMNGWLNEWMNEGRFESFFLCD